MSQKCVIGSGIEWLLATLIRTRREILSYFLAEGLVPPAEPEDFFEAAGDFSPPTAAVVVTAGTRGFNIID